MARYNPTFTEDELQNEAWKPVPNLEEYYEVSTLGRVRNIKTGMRRRAGHILALKLLPKGYVQVRPNLDGRPLYFYAHQLVAAAFIGPCPVGHEVNHKDFNRSNNRLGNLEYLTYQANKQYSRDRGRYDHIDYSTRKMPKGESHSGCRLLDSEIEHINNLLQQGIGVVHIARQFHVSHALISLIKHHKRRLVR